MRLLRLSPTDSRSYLLAAYRWWGLGLCVVLFALGASPAIAHSAGVNAFGPAPAEAASISTSGPIVASMPRTRLYEDSTEIALNAQTEYWLDDSANTLITDVVARAQAQRDLFKRSNESQVHQSQGKTLWLRFEAHSVDEAGHWLLELNSPLIDDAQLFWQDSNGRWQVRKSGDVVPRSMWPIRTRLPTFALQEGAGSPVQYYLRLQNARFPISIPLTIYRDSAWLAQQNSSHLLFGAMSALIALVLCVSAMMALGTRDISFAAYVVYLLALGMFMLTNSGLTSQYLWPNSAVLADRMNYTLAALVAALGPWLVRLILQPTTRLGIIDGAITVLALVMLCVTAFELFAPNQLSYRLLNIGTLVAVVVIYSLVASTWRRKDSMARWIATCFAPVALSAVPLIMRNLGFMANNWATQYGVLIAACIEMPLLLYAITLRSNRRREGQARALGLPMHDALTGLPNMRSFLEQLHGSITRAQRFKQSYGLILVDLSNHAWFIKEHGREMADRATVLCASRLERLIRDVDGICRIDESQFVILVEGHCSAVIMTKLSARIGACAHQPTDVLPVGASLKLVTTSALMPTQEAREAGDDANAQLGWLLAAAEAMPQESHKSARTIGF